MSQAFPPWPTDTDPLYLDNSDDSGSDSDSEHGHLIARSPWGSTCAECKRRKIKCLLENGYPCINCLDDGLAHKCGKDLVIESPEASPEPEEHPPNPTNNDPHVKPESPYTKILMKISHVKNTLYRYPRTAVAPLLLLFWLTIDILRWIYIHIVLLCIPRYYAGQAHDIIVLVEICDREYVKWAAECEAPQATPRVSDTNTVTVLTPPEMPTSVRTMQSKWAEFVEERKSEWNILLAISSMLLAASLTIFQIQGTTDDPFIRVFTILAICSAVMGILYGVILFFHFRLAYATDAHFAYLWFEKLRKGGVFKFWNLWVMLSLPKVATIWSMIMFMFALFAYIWRTGGASNSTPPPLPTNVAFVVRAAMQGLILIALAYMVVSLFTLHRLKKEVSMKKRGALAVYVPIELLPDISSSSEGFESTVVNDSSS